MRFAYLTTDEMNEALAQELALACSVALDSLTPKDGPPDEGYDAVLCDWDFWPAEHRQELLAGLDGPPYRPLAVHGHSLDAGQVEALRRRGVAVYVGLGPEVFLQLRGAALSARAAFSAPAQTGAVGVVGPA
jgi:hypothetical protein